MMTTQQPKLFNDLPVHSYAVPSIPVTDKRFVWTSPASTDVRKTWIKFGWTPPEGKS